MVGRTVGTAEEDKSGDSTLSEDEVRDDRSRLKCSDMP